MERRVWVKFYNGSLFPNLYVLLVGPPGIGKSQAIARGETLWRSVPEFHVAPSSVSKASLVDSLFDAKRTLVRPMSHPPLVEFNNLLVAASEFSAFLPAYDLEFMSALQKLYDGELYDERKRTKDIKFQIKHPLMTLLGGTTPNYMMNMFPEGAWDQGFASRTIIVFSAEKVYSDPFSSTDFDTELFNRLIADLRLIALAYGKMEWTADAATAYTTWRKAGEAPAPDHPKLLNYLTRRHTHLAKLCMVSSISRSSALVIEVEDYERALDWLVEAEAYMPDLFKSMVLGGDSAAMDEAYRFVWEVYAKERRGVLEHRIINFLRERVPSHSVMRVFEVMQRSRMVEQDGVSDRGLVLWKPAPKVRL